MHFYLFHSADAANANANFSTNAPKANTAPNVEPSDETGRFGHVLVCSVFLSPTISLPLSLHRLREPLPPTDGNSPSVLWDVVPFRFTALPKFK